MEFLFHLEPVSVLLALTTLLLFIFVQKLREISHGKSKPNKAAPQPSGAWPFIGHLHLLGRRDETIARTLGAMADQCGPIFSLKLGNNQAIIVSTSEIVKNCFTTNDAVLATRPAMALGKYMFYNHASFAISPYGPYWRHMRKTATVELLSMRRLESLSHVRLSEVDSCLKHLFLRCIRNNSEGCKGKVALDKWFEDLTFNINITMIVGKQYTASSYNDSNTNTYFSRFKKAIYKAAYLSGAFVPSDFIPIFECVDFGGYVSRMKETHKELDLIIGYWLDEHIKRRKESQAANVDNDFMDVLLSNLLEEEVVSGYDQDTIIKATALILLLTGSESTSVTLTWAVSLLLNHPQVLKAAQEELDAHVGKEKWVEESDIKNLPYLQSIVKETLRLYPPSPLTGAREAMEDCEISGYFVKKGTWLFVNLWKLHRDPRVWLDPGQFRPERFSSEQANIDFRGQQFEFIPFSSGRRSCPAMNFGLQVLHLMLARILQGFDISIDGGGLVDMREGLGLALHKATPLEVVLSPRLSSTLYQSL
ncbi:hypothetical protein Ancab_033787 [Ancistrocladus abbreviatus]